MTFKIRWFPNVKAILIEGRQWYYLTYSWGNKGVYTFLMIISPERNIIAWQKFELAYYVTFQHVSHNAMGILIVVVVVVVVVVILIIRLEASHKSHQNQQENVIAVDQFQIFRNFH